MSNFLNLRSYFKFIEFALTEIDSDDNFIEKIRKKFILDSQYFLLNQNFLIIEILTISVFLDEFFKDKKSQESQDTDVIFLREIRNAIVHNDYQMNDTLKIHTKSKPNECKEYNYNEIRDIIQSITTRYLCK